MKQSLGKLEIQLLAYTQMRQQSTVRAGELVKVLGLKPEQERQLFQRLARGRLIARVRPGLYLVPPRLPVGGAWSPDEITAIDTLLQDQNGKYQICGPNTFNRYNFDSQIPTRLYAYNNRISGERTIGAVQLTLIKVTDKRLGGIESVKTPQGTRAVYSSRARALVDAIDDWARFDTLPRAYGWIRIEIARKRVLPADIVGAALRYANVGTARRLGVLLEQISAAPKLLRQLEQSLPPSTSLIPWIPTLPKRGTVNRRWGVVVNANA